MLRSGYRPMHRAARPAARISLGMAATALCLLALTACGHLPWNKKPPAPPEPVHELVVSGADGTPAQGYPQYWKRNTLVVDLQAASGNGSITLKQGESAKWPVRLAFRVVPGTIGLLEVQADQRMLLPVASEGAKPVDLELVAGVYTGKTQKIVVRWEPARPPQS
ncbi:MAG: hypothetical protein WDO56_32360 [Gammaproteobacteria bacterium]